MSGVFMPDEPVVPAPGAPSPDRLIDTGGWFPPIDPALFRVEHRVSDSVTSERVRQALIAAAIGVFRDLSDWARTRRAEGAKDLAQVPTDLPAIDGESALVLLYRRAVSTAAKAELIERYRDMDITGAGGRGVEVLDPTISELRRDSTFAIRDIKNVGRCAVELI